MAEVVDVVEVRPRVFYRTIQIGPVFFGEPPADDDVVQIPGDGLRLNSSDNDFYPLSAWRTFPGTSERAAHRWSRVCHRQVAGAAGGTAVARRSGESRSASAPVPPAGSAPAPRTVPGNDQGAVSDDL